MNHPRVFIWRHFEAEIILPCVRWYLRDAFRYCDFGEILRERGWHVDQTTISQGVQLSALALEKRCRPHLTATRNSWRVNETSAKAKTSWVDLSRADDSEGNRLEFLLSPTHGAEVAKRFCPNTLAAPHTVPPGVIPEVLVDVSYQLIWPLYKRRCTIIRLWKLISIYSGVRRDTVMNSRIGKP